MCGRDSRDKLVQQLFKEHELCLLRVALTPQELAPGMVLSMHRSRKDERPVIRPLEALFSPVQKPKLSAAGFEPIKLVSSSSNLDAGLVARQSGLLNPNLSVPDIEAALKTSGSTSFEISLGGARRVDLDVHETEVVLRSAQHTAFGGELVEAGVSMFLVRRIVFASEVRLRGSGKIKASAAAKLGTLLGGSVRAVASGESEIVMARIEREMVIGFTAVEIVERRAGGFSLRGMTRPITQLGGESDEADNEPAETFADVEGELVALPVLP